MIQVTIACPEAEMADGANLAAVVGLSAADAETFALAPVAVDADGVRYRVASGLVWDDWPDRALAELGRPEWDVLPYRVSMAAANRAQALIRVGEAAAPDIIAVHFGDVSAAWAALGLTPEAAP